MALASKVLFPLLLVLVMPCQVLDDVSDDRQQLGQGGQANVGLADSGWRNALWPLPGMGGWAGGWPYGAQPSDRWVPQVDLSAYNDGPVLRAPASGKVATAGRERERRPGAPESPLSNQAALPPATGGNLVDRVLGKRRPNDLPSEQTGSPASRRQGTGTPRLSQHSGLPVAAA
jgi:hypothetical protein